MKIINLPQRSPEWHVWRKGGVSASAAAVILNRSPYKTLWRLWAEKTGRAVEEDLSKNPNVMRGFKLEDRARQCCERALGEDFLLPVCAQSDDNPLVLASFDGLTESNIPTELKCPCEKNYDSVVKDGEASESYELYYPQIQQQIYVADAPYGWLMFYSPEDNGDHRLLKVPRDDALISDLVTGIEQFWDRVQKDQPPPMDLERDLFIPSDREANDWIYHATDYRLLDQQIRGMEEKIKELKGKRDVALNAMKGMMGGFYKADFAGVSITRFEKQGGIDYDKYLTENYPSVRNDDLEKYRKDGTTQYRVTVTNKAMPRNIVDLDIQETLSDVEDGELKSMYF
ncbi:MAG: endonuclease [gamma proteobacterium symbiont of Clathrolucina costata]